MLHDSQLSSSTNFFLENAGELRIIISRRKGEVKKDKPHTTPHNPHTLDYM
jgi:hypothetical protein